MHNLLKKTIAVTTSVTTILSLSGVALFAPAFVFAATISDGDTITTADSFDIYIAKHVGDKKFKRLILNPTVFESYGHLEWDDVKTVTQAEQDEYTTSNLVRAINDEKVYKLTPDGDEGTRQWLNMTAAEFVSEGYDWDSIYEINEVDRDNYTSGSDVAPDGDEAAVGAVSVSLASDSPAAANVAMGSSNVIFTKINFVGGSSASTISQVSVRRAGIANDSDISDVKVWDGSTQLDATQAINSTTHKAKFTNLGWVVPANTTKVLTITGSIAASGTAATGTAPRLGIEAASDVTSDGDISGSFPVYGNSMTIAGISVGRLDVTANTFPGDNTPIAGTTDQEISSFNFNAVNEGMSLRSVMLTQVGTVSNSDLSNIKLKISGAQVGSTIASLASDGTATFDFSGDPIGINSGTSKDIYVHADIAPNAVSQNNTRTAEFEITNSDDVTAFGTNSAGSVTITGASGATFSSANPATSQTVSQGTLLDIAANGATNPSAQTFVRGADQVLIAAYRFSAPAGEDQRVSRLKLELGGSGADSTDVSNITLYKYDESTATETQVGTPTGFVGTVATYGANTTGLDEGVFDVPAGDNVIIHVRADVSSAASWSGLGIFINNNGARIDGVTSEADIGTATDDTVDALGDTAVTTHAAHAASGTLTMSVSPTNPAAQNVVPGTTGYVFGKFDFTMANEPATLSALTVNICQGGACTDGSAGDADSSDLTNVKLWNGATQLGTTVATPSTAANFSFNLNLPKDETVTLTFTADVPTSAASDWGANSQAAVAIDAALTTTGVWSGADISDPGSDALGNIMTASAETLTAAFQNAPASTIIVNQSQAVLSKVVLTAGNAGDVRVTSVKFTAATTSVISNAVDNAADSDFGTLKLYDVTDGANNQLGITLSSFTNRDGGSSAAPDTASFTGLSLSIGKGLQKVLELRANVLSVSGSDVDYYVGIDALDTSTSDVVASGISSNTTIYATGSEDDASGAIRLASAGTLTVAVDAATPVSQFVAVGTSGKAGVEFAKWKFSSTNEPIEVNRLSVTLAQDDNNGDDNNDVPNFSSLKLYKGSTKVGSTVYPTGSNDSGTSTLTFVFDDANDEFVVPKDGDVVLTLKADMNGTSNGANSTTTPNFFVAVTTGNTSTLAASDVDALGSSSGGRVTVNTGTPDPSALTGTEPDNTNHMRVARSKPVFALCTASNCSKASPSGALTPGTIEVIRFRIAAEGDDVVFDSNSNIQFTITQSGAENTATETADLYEVGKTAVIATQVSSINLSTATDINFDTGLSTTISKDTYKEYYVKVDLADYATAGESFKLTIDSASGDVSYDDQVTPDITNAPALDGLPMDGNTLVY